ncbi:MAG: glycosyltransferase family 2 protein [Herpetosiphon sp.]
MFSHRSASRPSVIVASWNGLGLLQTCLDGLKTQSADHELVVVDNGSVDGTAEWVQEYEPRARLVALPRNLGFAGGYNAGMSVARGDLLVLINNDTIPPPEFVEELVRPFADDAHIGATGGVLTFAHRRDRIASAGIEVGADGVHRDRALGDHVASLPPLPIPIFGASGGAVCYRRRALDDVGRFPAHFFAYLEDADLAWRLRLRGWETVLAPHARLPHVYSATSGQGSPLKQRLLARNRWYVLLRCMPGSLLRACWPAMLRYDLLALAWALGRRQSQVARGRIEAWSRLRPLLHERQQIQQRRTAAHETLKSWVNPPFSVQQTLAEGRTLQRLLGAVRSADGGAREGSR